MNTGLHITETEEDSSFDRTEFSQEPAVSISANDQKNMEIIAHLERINVNKMTPVAALNMLDLLKSKLSTLTPQELFFDQ